MTDKPTVIAVDTTKGNALVHFSNGVSVLFQAHFLWKVREDDGNSPIPEPMDIDEE